MQSTDVTTAPGAFADVAALRACWHPVAFGRDLGNRPVHADLLGEPLVLWRGPDGGPRANSDLCVHRGTALSLGWVSGDELVCPYHGWRYRADGPLRRDPAAGGPVAGCRPRPGSAAFGCQERYGLIWVALAEPRWPLPEVPELEDGGWAVVTAGPVPLAAATPPARWRTSPTSGTSPGCTRACWATRTGRWCRGTRSAPRTTCCTTRSSGRRRRTPTTSRCSATSRPGRRSGAAATSCTCRTRSCCGSAGAASAAWCTSSPPSRSAPTAAPGYVVIGRNYNLDQPDRVIQEFEDTIFGQDQVVVESQRPERVPFDLAAELHLKFDAVAVAYRKAMRAARAGHQRRHRPRPPARRDEPVSRSRWRARCR